MNISSFSFFILILCLLSGCSGLGGLFLAGVIGAGVTPIVQPQIDRGLHLFNMDWMDPAGTSAVVGFDNTSVVAPNSVDKK